MKVELDLMETGYLCNLIMGRLMAADCAALEHVRLQYLDKSLPGRYMVPH